MAFKHNSNNITCSTYSSQLDMEKMMWQTSPAIIPTAPHRSEMRPAYYTPTPYHFIFNNVGIPTRFGHKSFFYLNKPRLFCITTPTMLIATMKTNTLLKVGLDFAMQNDVNSAVYDFYPSADQLTLSILLTTHFYTSKWILTQ